MIKCLLVAACFCAASGDEIGDMMSELETVLSDTATVHTEQRQEDQDIQDETAKFLAGAEDKVAAVVDQTLMGAAEEDLANKQAEDPLLADPLLSLEEEEAEIGTAEGEQVAGDIASIHDWKKAAENAPVPLFDPSLFKDDSVAAMDLNDDGLLERKELESHIMKMIRKAHKEEFERQKVLNQDQVNDIIKLMDVDKDGKLSMEELFSKTTQTAKEKIADERMFNFADTDKDHKLDAGEMFLLALPQYSGDRVAWFKFKAKDHMEEMDTNGDKFVTWPEMEESLNKYEMDESERVIARFKKNFALSDKDPKDDKLDEEEMALLVQRLENEDITLVEDLIKMADDNGDGKLSLNEIIKNVKELKGRMSLFMAAGDLLYVNPTGQGSRNAEELHHSYDKMLSSENQDKRDKVTHARFGKKSLRGAGEN